MDGRLDALLGVAFALEVALEVAHEPKVLDVHHHSDDQEWAEPNDNGKHVICRQGFAPF
jgi:hypothetical protein